MTLDPPLGAPNSDQPVIRRAVSSDAATIHRLVIELAESTGLAQKATSRVEDILAHGFGPDPAFQALIAEHRNEALGLCLFFESYSSWDGRRGVYVQDLYVTELARGLGLGRRLLAEVVALSLARGGNYLRLAVDAGNADAQAFYRSVGLDPAIGDRIYQARDQRFARLATGAKGVGR